MADDAGLRYGYFWNDNNGDREYDADAFANWLGHFFTSGVFANELQVTAAGHMDVQVATGYANCKGKVRIFSQPTTLSLEVADATYPRYDTVVVERNDTDRQIIVKVVKGTAQANPQPTAPVRTDYVFQLVLAQIYVGAGITAVSQANITDKRSDASVCGIVAGTVKEIDFSQFAAQFAKYYDEFKANNKADFDTWFKQVKDVLSSDAAGNLQNEITSTTENITLSAANWTSDGVYTISNALVTAKPESNQDLEPAAGITKEQRKAFDRATINQHGQTDGSFSIIALGRIPTIDIPVTVTYRGVK